MKDPVETPFTTPSDAIASSRASPSPSSSRTEHGQRQHGAVEVLVEVDRVLVTAALDHVQTGELGGGASVAQHLTPVTLTACRETGTAGVILRRNHRRRYLPVTWCQNPDTLFACRTSVE